MNKKVLFLATFSAFAAMSCQKSTVETPQNTVAERKVSGNVNCISGATMQDVKVYLTTQGTTLETKTDAQGKFSFSNVPTGASIEVSASFQDNTTAPISTFDLVLISKKILGTEQNLSPLQKLTCDLNNDGAVSSADVIAFREVSLGLKNVDATWFVVSKAYEQGNSQNTAFTSTETSADITNIAFVAARLADPNGTTCK